MKIYLSGAVISEAVNTHLSSMPHILSYGGAWLLDCLAIKMSMGLVHSLRLYLAFLDSYRHLYVTDGARSCMIRHGGFAEWPCRPSGYPPDPYEHPAAI